MTIVHHAGKAGAKPRLYAQEVLARRIYARKHFAAPHRALYVGALVARYALRAVVPNRSADSSQRRIASREALRTLLSRAEPPFGPPPETSIDPSTVGSSPR
jgi:hypothetical protein